MTTQIEPTTVAVASEPPVDQRVLDVQEWLYTTYGQGWFLEHLGEPVPWWMDQWIEVPLTGRTGWSTMYGLTRALQIELGITTLSNNFGDGTLAALAAQFSQIDGSTTSSDPEKLKRIVTIIQGGLYCKGYNPAGLDGNFGPGCAAAVNSMKTDMGFTTTSPGTVTPKIFKGLLTMDAYVLLPGGTAAARSVQQWLNNTYLGRKNFFVMPCDGLYSRNTQKALVYALQYEIGMNDATANGNFGPGTRDGVRDHGTFTQGAQDPGGSHWVRLFHGALIFNKYQVPFDSTFSASDSAVVESFQDFCKLDVNGNADYRTWCSLLVSNGDPTRPGTACDTRVQIDATFGSILSNLGYETVGRYLTNARVASPLDKEIKPGELNAIFNAGLSVFPIYQEVGSTVGNFSYAAGLEAGFRADRAARAHRIPEGTTIYFAVDFDPTDDQIVSAVIPHFRGINTALAQRGKRFRVGAYGTRNVCQTLTDAGLSWRSFVAGMSTGYSGNLGYTLPTNWAFDQIFEYTVTTGLPLDKNIKSGRDQGFSTLAPAEPAVRNSALQAWLRWLEGRAVAYHNADPTRPSPGKLMSGYIRRNHYNGTDWDFLAGPISADWISFVDGELTNAPAGVAEVLTYVDIHELATGTTYETPHLFAAIDTYLNRGPWIEQSSVHSSEVGGWAGDLLSVLNAWVAYSNAPNRPPMSIAEYAQASIGCAKGPLSNGLLSAFNIEDLVQDADASIIAAAYHADPGTSIADAVIEHIERGGPSAGMNRFEAFAVGRFGGSVGLQAAARSAFQTEVDSSQGFAYLTLRTALLQAGNPPVWLGDFTEVERQAVADAFSTKVLDLV